MATQTFANRMQTAAEAARPIAGREAAAMQSGTHSLTVGYICWVFGFVGAHRFYYGKPITGTLWFFTGGLLGIGWLVDLFLIPLMHRSAERRYVAGPVDYNIAWLLLTFLGPFGAHRLYMGKWITGASLLAITATGVVLFPLLLIPIAVQLYDFLTLNEQITEMNVS